MGFRRPGASWIAASSMKASKAATSMVYHVGRAPDHGAGQGTEQKLMARPLAPRCGTIYGHMAALATVMLIQPCTPVHGVHNILVDHPASWHGKGNSAQPCGYIMLSPKSIQEKRTRNVPSGKMLLARLGLHQGQGSCGQPVR